MLKRLLSHLILGALFFSSLSAQTVIPGGNVSGTWEASGSPFLIEGEITVPAGDTLIIESGVEVCFQGHYKFIANGTLDAVGTEADSILFTAANPDTGWHGIRFYNASDGSHLTFCTIQHGLALDITGVEDSYGGGVFCSQSHPTISRCTIRSNEADYMGGGICAYDDSQPVIDHCGICDNSAGVVGGGLAYYMSSGTVDSCTVSGNWTGCYGGGIYCYFSDPTITHCDINANTADDGEAGGVACNNSSPVVYHCTINDNWASYAGGGFCCVSSGASVSYCVVSGNGSGWYGGGIKCSYSRDTFANCTVSRNSAGYAGGGFDCGYSGADILNTIVEGNSGGGGMYFYYPQNMSITYSDFYNNQGGNFTGTGIPTGLGQITGLNANGDPCDVFYNIFGNPLFENPAAGNFQITWANYPVWDQTRSPCIDAGHPRSPYDADSTVADIGALYFHQGAVPNIELSTTWLDFDSVLVGTQAELSLTIYNAGDTILVLYNVYNDDPAFSTDWDPVDSLIAPGDSLQISVFFLPEAVIAYLDTLIIENNDEPAAVRLQGAGSGPVAVSLIPYNPPIVVPASGGSFDFNVAAVNLAASAQTFDLWMVVHLPGVGEFEVLNVPDLTLPPNATAGRDRTQLVPGFAPAGTYFYYAYVGDYPWVVENCDWFTFEKWGTHPGGVLGAASLNGGSLGTPSDWICSGQGFEAWQTELENEIPAEFRLNQVFPNPFNETTTISFELRDASFVRLEVFDIQGRLIWAHPKGGLRSSHASLQMAAGRYEVTFDGSGSASGVYIYRLKTSQASGSGATPTTVSGKMVLMK